ncbi:MAG: hypothetical protein WCJ29_06420 [bacterium]
MTISGQDIARCFQVYSNGVSNFTPAERKKALLSLLGMKGEENLLMRALTLHEPIIMWKQQFPAATDYTSALQRERISFQPAVERFAGMNFGMGVAAVRLCAARLLALEAIPETLIRCSRFEPDYWEQADIEGAQLVYTTMMAGAFNLSEINVSSIGVTREGLGNQIEDAKVYTLGRGLARVVSTSGMKQ